MNYVNGNPISYADPDGLKTIPDTLHPWKIVKKGFCKAVKGAKQVTDKMLEDSRARADATYKGNAKKITDGANLDISNCLSKSCDRDACIAEAAEKERRLQRENFAWYQQAIRRPPTPVEEGFADLDRACEVIELF